MQNILKSEIDRLTREYKADLQNGDFENAMSKLHTVIGLPMEMMAPVNEDLLQELRTIQKVFEVKEAQKCEKIRSKKLKEREKLDAEYHKAKNDNNFGKAEKLNIKWTKVLSNMFLYVESIEGRKEHNEYRKGVFHFK